MTKDRDNQKSRLYAAENEALKPLETALPKVGDVERFLKKELKRKTLVRRYGRALDLVEWPIRVHAGQRHRNASAYGTRTIAIPLWARNDRVVLHEVAHIVHNRLVERAIWCRGERALELRDGASHGWQFAAIYLDLVRFIMGKAAGDALKVAFKKHRVRYRKPRTAVAWKAAA